MFSKFKLVIPNTRFSFLQLPQIGFLVFILFILPNFSLALNQIEDNRWRETGLPYIQTYKASEHGGSYQNWEIVQDSRGIMYIANTFCLLEYDGVSWRQIMLPNKLTVWSVDIDSKDRIWVGSTREFGYFIPDSTGSLNYNSLWKYLPESIKKAEVRWYVNVASNGVFIHSKNTLIRWDEQSGKLKIWEHTNKIWIWVVNNNLFVDQSSAGLFVLRNDSLHSIPEGKQFATRSTRAILPYSPSKNISSESIEVEHTRLKDSNTFSTANNLLIASNSNGLFIFNNNQVYPFETDADDYLKRNKIYCGTKLSNGNYAFGTRYGGIVIIDAKGKLQLILNKSNGLPDNLVYGAFNDKAGGLWLALDKGLSRVEINSPLSLFSNNSILKSGVQNIARHNGELFVSTSKGLLKMEQSSIPGFPQNFTSVSELEMLGGALLSFDKDLLLTSHEGLFKIRNDEAQLMNSKESETPLLLHPSRYDKNRVYVGLLGGLGILQWENNKWYYAGEIPGIYESVEGIEEEGNNVLWLTTHYGDATRIITDSLTLNSLLDSSKIKIERFGEANGLSIGWVGVKNFNNQILFPTQKGLRYFDSEKRKFLLSTAFGNIFADTTCNIDSKYFLIDEKERVLTRHSGSIGIALPKNNNTYTWYKTPFLRFSERIIWTYYIDEKYPGIFWFGGAEGIIRYDETVNKDYSVKYPVLLRRVIVNSDSIIYDGAFADPMSGMRAPILNYNNNTIRIEYAAPYYDNETENQYQYFLEGFDDNWSDWTNETMVDYRKIPEGNYTFHVRARNIYQSEGKESVFSFTILPPIYRTWYSYALYVLIVLGIFSAARRYELNRKRHKQQAELNHVEAKKLKELDKLKTRFFANISHEFRTPLTMILGPADKMIKNSNGEEEKNLKLIRNNAKQLLRLINQLLDVSKLENGKIQLKTREGNFIQFLKGLVLSFETLAVQKRISLNFEVKNINDVHNEQVKNNRPTYFDQDKIEKIFTNLLSNAFKFTPNGGCINVTVLQLSKCSPNPASNGTFQRFEVLHAGCGLCSNSNDTQSKLAEKNNCFEISVMDTGEGIPQEHLPNIFDRFYQADSSSVRTHGGTGIGLALVKELVKIHYGTIAVESKEGRGTTFKICIPLGKDHLKVEELVEPHPNKLPEGTIKNFEDINSISTEILLDSGETEENSDNQTLQLNNKTDRPVVLIIEDNTDVRNFIQEQLQKEYFIYKASNGEEGIKKAIEVIPDLVISDVMMPIKNGYVVCRELKTDEHTSHIPVILLTAKASDSEKLTGLETGADDYIVKPFKQEELLARVRNLIELRKKLRQRFSNTMVIKPSEVRTNSMDRIFLTKCITAIEAHYDDEFFGVEALANQVAMSVSQLNRKLNALISQPAGQMIRSMRLQRAADLLKTESGTVTEICFMVGFGNQANFTRSFKKQFGCSPSEFRKRNKN